MKLSWECEVGHEPARHALAQPARVSLERGFCPVCPGKELEGQPSGGLGWARCPCCGSHWRLEDDGFALRPGRILEEWT